MDLFRVVFASIFLIISSVLVCIIALDLLTGRDMLDKVLYCALSSILCIILLPKTKAEVIE